MQHTIKPHWKFIERVNLETLQKEVNDFSDKNEVQEVLLTTRQGGTGLSLPRASAILSMLR